MPFAFQTGTRKQRRSNGEETKQFLPLLRRIKKEKVKEGKRRSAGHQINHQKKAERK